MTKVVLLDGYELNEDLDWSSLQKFGQCVFYDRSPMEDDHEVLRRIGDAELIITHKTPITKRVIQKAPHLKYIGIMGTGYDVVDIESAHEQAIIVTNIPTYASDAVAQFTFSLLLEVTGQVGLHNQLVHNDKWSEVPDFTFWAKPLLELKGKTLGLIGYGHIAQKVAQIARGFSMHVIFYNHRAKQITDCEIRQVSLDELLEASDVISLHVIQTPETIDLINRETLAKMKPHAIVLNTARGKLVNESDMAQALNQGRIYAYATDVVQKEPIEKNHPLLQAANCYITPHIAWAPFETRERLLAITVENIAAYLSGHPVNRVD